MRNQNIDQCWQFQHELYDEFPDAEKAKSVREVNLPHDYMIESNVSESFRSCQRLLYTTCCLLHKINRHPAGMGTGSSLSAF